MYREDENREQEVQSQEQTTEQEQQVSGPQVEVTAQQPQQEARQQNVYYQQVNPNPYQWSTQKEPQPDMQNGSEAPRTPKNGFGTKLARCTAYALTFGLVSGALFQGSSYMTGRLLGNQNTTVISSTQSGNNRVATTTTATSSNLKSTTDVSKVVTNVMPSIVAITNLSQEEVQTWFGQTQTYESQSAGSGIIIKQEDDTLYIVTNNHVVNGSKTLTVQFSDEKTAPAEIQGTDADNDLAVIKVKIKDLSDDTQSKIKVASFGDSDKVEVGASAIAIGNALGYGQSVTTGVISAVNRGVTSQDENSGQTNTNYLLQTDAAINPGNSGGALINSDGEVIGINSAKYSDTSVEGMGFAIPANTASDIVKQLIKDGAVTSSKKAYLGIYGQNVTEDIANTYKMPKGVYITDVVEGEAADQAGLKQGMIITAINDKEVSTMQELKAEISKCKPGDKVTLKVQATKNSEYVEKEVEVTLKELKADAAQRQAPAQGKQNVIPQDPQQQDPQQQTPGADGSKNDLFEYFFGGHGNDNGNSNENNGQGNW